MKNLQHYNWTVRNLNFNFKSILLHVYSWPEVVLAIMLDEVFMLIKLHIMMYYIANVKKSISSVLYMLLTSIQKFISQVIANNSFRCSNNVQLMHRKNNKNTWWYTMVNEIRKNETHENSYRAYTIQLSFPLWMKKRP